MRGSRFGFFVVGALAAVLAFGPGPAAGVDSWVRPVTGRVVRGFRAPVTRYGAGHLGVDFAAASGTPVRAAGAGIVVFAGVVAHARHVVVGHAGGLRTSYSFLASIRVHAGQHIGRGTVVGTAGATGEHHAGGVLHFGLRIGETFVDPMQLFGSLALAAPVHLAPVVPAPADLGAERRVRAEGFGARLRAVVSASTAPGPPLLPAALPICDGSVALRC